MKNAISKSMTKKPTFCLCLACFMNDIIEVSCPKRVEKSGKASHSVSDLLKVKTTSNRSIKKYILIKMLGGDDVSGKKK